MDKIDIFEIIANLKKILRGYKKILKGLKDVEEEFREHPELSEELKDEYEDYINDINRVGDEYRTLENTVNYLDEINEKNELKSADISVEEFIEVRGIWEDISLMRDQIDEIRGELRFERESKDDDLGQDEPPQNDSYEKDIKELKSKLEETEKKLDTLQKDIKSDSDLEEFILDDEVVKKLTNRIFPYSSSEEPSETMQKQFGKLFYSSPDS